MESNFQGAILGPQQAQQQRNNSNTKSKSFFNLNTVGLIIVIFCIIGLIWYFTSKYAKKEDLDKVISIVKLMEEEIDLIKKSQEEYRKQTLELSANLNNNKNAAPYNDVLRTTVSAIDQVNNNFNSLSDREKQENIANYTQQLKNLVDNYNNKLHQLTEATRQALDAQNSSSDPSFDSNEYKQQFDNLLAEYNTKLSNVAHGDLDSVLEQFRRDIEELKRQSSSNPGSTTMKESDEQSFNQQVTTLSEEHRAALDKLNNLNVTTYTTELDNLKQSYQDQLNALNELHNTAQSVSAELQGLDVDFYRNKYQELIDTYTQNLADLNTQYVNILDIKDKRNVDLNAIVTAFEEANQYLEDQKRYFNDEIQRLVSRAGVIAESTAPAGTGSSDSGSGVSSTQITGLQTLINANEDAISELRRAIQSGLTRSDLDTSTTRLNDLITANTNAINQMISDASNYGNKTTIKATTDSLNTLIQNNTNAIQELQNLASSVSNTTSSNQTNVNTSITNLQTLIDDNKKEIDTLKTNVNTMVKQSDLNDAITSLQSVINTNSTLINNLQSNKVTKVNYDDTINNITTLIDTNRNAISALENVNRNTDLSGYINQTALDTAIGNLRRIVKNNEDAIKILQSDTATAIQTVDFENLEEIFITQQLHVGNKFQPNAGIMNLYAASGGGVDAGATIKFLNSAGREYFFITSVVDNPGIATEKAYFKIANGGLKVDKKAIFEGNVEIKKKLDAPKIKISKSSTVTEDGALLEKSGHLQLQSSNNGQGGWIEFVDETVQNNTWFYMQGTPGGLYVSKSAAIQGSLMVATVESSPAKIIFKDRGGSTHSYLELQSSTGGANHALFTPEDFKVGKNTKISGNLEVDGSITLKDGNGQAIKADFMELKNNLTVTGDVTTHGKTTLHGELDAKTKLTAHTQAEFKDGIISKGVSLFRGKTTHPSSIKMSQEAGQNSHLSFLDSNEQELSKLLATENGLSIETGELSVNNMTKALGGLSIGRPGKADGWNSKLTLYGAGNPNYIEFRSNQQTNGEYERQGYIQGVGGLNGGLAIHEGPLDIYRSLNVRQNTTLVGNTSASNITASGNIESQDLTAKRNLFVIQNGVIDGTLRVKGDITFDSRLDVTGHSQLNTLELTGSVLDVGHQGVATENSNYTPGRININSSYNNHGKLVFRNRDRTDMATMTIGTGGKIRFTGRDAHFDENISTAKNITASGGHITGNYLTSTNDVTVGGNVNVTGSGTFGSLSSNQDIRATRYITADNNIRSKTALQVGDGSGNIRNISSHNGWLKSHDKFYTPNEIRTDTGYYINGNKSDMQLAYNIQLKASGYEQNKFYPVSLYLHQLGSYNKYPVIRFQISGESAAAADPNNDNTLFGYVRGGGHSDKNDICETYFRSYTSERKILAIYKGLKTFKGIVIYLRGDYNYTLITNADDVRIGPHNDHLAPGPSGRDNSVFPVLNKDYEKQHGNDLLNVTRIQDVYNSRNGKFILHNFDVGENARIRGNTTVDGKITINNVDLEKWDAGLRVKQDGNNNTQIKFGEWKKDNSVGYIKWHANNHLKTNSKIETTDDVTATGSGTFGSLTTGGDVTATGSGTFGTYVRAPEIQVGAGSKKITVNDYGFVMNDAVHIEGDMKANKWKRPHHDDNVEWSDNWLTSSKQFMAPRLHSNGMVSSTNVRLGPYNAAVFLENQDEKLYTASDIKTDGAVTATGAGNFGSLTTGGAVTATGDGTFGNLTASGKIQASGTIDSLNHINLAGTQTTRSGYIQGRHDNDGKKIRLGGTDKIELLGNVSAGTITTNNAINASKGISGMRRWATDANRNRRGWGNHNHWGSDKTGHKRCDHGEYVCGLDVDGGEINGMFCCKFENIH